MPQQLCPEWMKSACNQRFNELAVMAGKKEQLQSLQQKQNEITKRLKSELTLSQYQIILEWEEIMNLRNAVEKEFMYFAGIKDGMKILKELQDFMSG